MRFPFRRRVSPPAVLPSFLVLCPRRRASHLYPVRLPRDNLQRGRRYCMSDARVSFSVSFRFCFSGFFLRRRVRHRWRRKNPLCKMAAEDIYAVLLRSQNPFLDARLRPVLQSPRQKAAAAAVVVAEEIAIAAIVFFLAENPARSYFTSRTHSRRTVMNYERNL